MTRLPQAINICRVSLGHALGTFVKALTLKRRTLGALKPIQISIKPGARNRLGGASVLGNHCYGAKDKSFIASSGLSAPRVNLKPFDQSAGTVL